MRKLYLALLTFLFVTTFVHAQIKKGSTFLGGDIGGSTQKTQTGNQEAFRQWGISLSPVYGKAIKDNLILGGDLTFAYSEYDNIGSEQRINVYGGGVFLRKYKSLGNSGFFIFLQGRTGYRYLQSKIEAGSVVTDRVKNHSVNLSMYPGLSYALNRKLHLESGFNNLISLNYYTEKRITTGTPDILNRNSGFSISSSLNNISNLYLGFRVILGK
jgi:hypothetical protein